MRDQKQAATFIYPFTHWAPTVCRGCVQALVMLNSSVNQLDICGLLPLIRAALVIWNTPSSLTVSAWELKLHSLLPLFSLLPTTRAGHLEVLGRSSLTHNLEDKFPDFRIAFNPLKETTSERSIL